MTDLVDLMERPPVVEVRVPPTGQCLTLLQAFQRGEVLTTLEATLKYGITTISQRCGDLRMKYGWPIQSEPVEGKPYKRYWMEV